MHDMIEIIDLLGLMIIFGLTFMGLMLNLFLNREVKRTQPLNVAAPKFIFSIFKFNIYSLLTSLFLISLVMLYYTVLIILRLA